VGWGLALPLAGILILERPVKFGDVGETTSPFEIGGERGAVEGRSKRSVWDSAVAPALVPLEVRFWVRCSRRGGGGGRREVSSKYPEADIKGTYYSSLGENSQQCVYIDLSAK